MLFLAPLYNYLASQYATRINHFALIKLTLQGLDKTIFYFLLFALVRVIWLLAVRKRRGLWSEFGLWLFAFYFLLVLMLTTFRIILLPLGTEFPLDAAAQQYQPGLHEEYLEISLCPEQGRLLL